MNTDPGQPEPDAPRPDHDFPRVIAIRARRIPFTPPSLRNFTSTLPRLDNTIEFLVETDGPIPSRALSPVLLVGETPAGEATQDDPTSYRFVTLYPDALEPGAQIRLAWSGRPTEEGNRTGFHYTEPGDDWSPQPTE